jgi:hypothetical protein
METIFKFQNVKTKLETLRANTPSTSRLYCAKGLVPSTFPFDIRLPYTIVNARITVIKVWVRKKWRPDVKRVNAVTWGEGGVKSVIAREHKGIHIVWLDFRIL